MKKTLIKRITSTIFVFLFVLGTSFVGPFAFAKPYLKVFPAKYDNVWKSTLIAITKYPLEKNDKSSGEIKTSTIESGQIYKAYKDSSKNGELYTMNISLERRRLRGKKVVVVKVEKNPMIKGDFMNKDQFFESDGIEETVLLYRIARELKIDRTVERLFNK